MQSNIFLGNVFSGDLIPPVSRPQGLGKVFFVDNQIGNNDYNGVDPGTPFLTVAYALSQCVDHRGDYIFLVDYRWGTTELCPIDLNKHNVHIIGVRRQTLNNYRYCTIQGATNNVFRSVGATINNVELAGIHMTTDGAAGLSIEGGSSICCGWHIHHCGFGVMGATQDGIAIQLSGGNNEFQTSLVEFCFFGPFITRDGIRTDPTGGAPTWSWFCNNIFWKCAGRGINLQYNVAAQLGGILDNTFFQKIDPDKGSSIYINKIEGGIITGNRTSHTAQDPAIPGNNPYMDETTANVATTRNAWGRNWAGESLEYPEVA